VRTLIGVRALAAGTALVLAGVALAGCSQSEADNADRLRVGYFPNVTHAPALVGVDSGLFAAELGPDVELEAQTFNAGTAAVEAIMGGALDVVYLGPNPAVQAFVQSDGEAIRVVSGAASGGAAFVVQPEIDGVDDLLGEQVGSPQLGNTQDIALRYWLKEQGIDTEVSGRGDVTIVSAENATILQQFQEGAIAGAWVPEPWVSRLVQEAGGKVLVDESDLWPDGRFVTTQVLVRTAYLEEYPELVEAFLRGHVAAIEQIEADPDSAKLEVNAEIEEITGKALTPGVLDSAWAQMEFTADPIAPTLQASATHAVEVGVTEEDDITGIYDLRLLNAVLRADGQEPVSADGLGLD
jgi:NitT/TauT family transport system substrate-binding protein